MGGGWVRRAARASSGPGAGSTDTVARRTVRERAAASSAVGRGRAGAGGNRAEAPTGALLGGCCENASSPRKRARRRAPTAACTVPAAGTSTNGLDAAWNGAEMALGSGTSSAMRRHAGTTRLPISYVQERASGIERETAENSDRLASSRDSIRHSRLESFKTAPLSLSKGGSGELEFAGEDGTANLAVFLGRARDFAALRADRILFSALDDRAEEASVVGCPAQPVQDEFGHGHRVQLLQALAQHPDLTQLLVGEQQFLTPRPRGLDVDGRERAALLQLTVQVQLHVA